MASKLSKFPYRLYEGGQYVDEAPKLCELISLATLRFILSRRCICKGIPSMRR